MSIFKTLLIPYDGSPACISAAEKAFDIATDQGAALVGLKVISFEGELVPPSDQLWATIIEDLKKKGRAVLDDLVSSANNRGLAISLEVTVGEVEDEIVAVAAASGADLVVMGVGERVGMHRVNVRRLVKDAPCPVLLVG